ncbi:DFP-domain-containing protein [Cylindrobasidium torrendii FP15055 ss-10]|uniref:DFP-domain-containing protein n=1 Tax=Cylindrobasidium torrendii FP15055 ss-10 TaxID=1314674 RepID=A0A0D7BR60_9AGAR|nr:DFP-domain-containing protein [Cylindrobasidium torrendii FP15055 ss-10]
MSEPFSAETYFATQGKPASLDAEVRRVREFVRRQRDAGRNVVLVTSGGTTVPLEVNVVRFLDNFSAGTRGATSAEYFLKAGYAVIFMHRQFSLQPFSRHYSHSTNPFLDLLEVVPAAASNTAADADATAKTTSGNAAADAASTASSDAPSADATAKTTSSNAASTAPTTPTTSTISVTPSSLPHLTLVLSTYKSVQAAGTLLTLTFVTVNDYLWMLRAVSKEMSAVLGRRGLWYLAAAVSDFYVPGGRMSEHKIQSGKGSLLIEMDQVPKILKTMVDEWADEGYIVSFKLETDPALLIPKAHAALERYGHQVVIGNDLNRRKFEVVFVERAGAAQAGESEAVAGSAGGAEAEAPAGKAGAGSVGAAGKADIAGSVGAAAGKEEPKFIDKWLRIDLAANPEREIEEDIVGELVRQHAKWIRDGEV